MVKELVCGHGNEGSIPSNVILNLVLIDYNMTACVLNDYKMTTYFYLNLTHVNITHSSFGHNLTPCHVELFKQIVWHDFNDHSQLIQYDYKSIVNIVVVF
jgi:hypothetical protein